MDFTEIMETEFTPGEEIALECGVVKAMPGTHWWTDWYRTVTSTELITPAEPSKAELDVQRTPVISRTPDDAMTNSGPKPNPHACAAHGCTEPARICQCGVSHCRSHPHLSEPPWIGDET